MSLDVKKDIKCFNILNDFFNSEINSLLIFIEIF